MAQMVNQRGEMVQLNTNRCRDRKHAGERSSNDGRWCRQLTVRPEKRVHPTSDRATSKGWNSTETGSKCDGGNGSRNHVPVGHNRRCSLVGYAFGGMTDLSAERFQERQDGLAELHRQQVSMVTQPEMGSFVSEDCPTFIGTERRQQARRHDDATDSGGNRIRETTLRFHDLEPTAPSNAVHGLPTGEHDPPATKRRDE